MKILFIRHAQTKVNEQGLLHRKDDPSALSETGMTQSKEIVNLCRLHKVQLVMTSPEKRARQTSAIVSDELGVPLKELNGLQERNWGDWSSRKWDEIQVELDKMSLEKRYSFVPPHGESWEDLEHRLKNCLQVIVAQPNEVVAVFTHGGVMRALMPILLHKPKESSFQYDFANTEAIIFTFEDNTFKQLH